ncbi:hypothetical protein PSTT_06013, partial [Puccinia striiformis]
CLVFSPPEPQRRQLYYRRRSYHYYLEATSKHNHVISKLERAQTAGHLCNGTVLFVFSNQSLGLIQGVAHIPKVGRERVPNLPGQGTLCILSFTSPWMAHCQGMLILPRNYRPGTTGVNGIQIVSLDQAIGMLEATPSNVPVSDDKDVDGTLQGQRANKNREKTEDESSKDHSNRHKSFHHDTQCSTRPTSSLLDVPEVPLGDPLHTSCVSKNAWVFEKIVKMENCNHYFHAYCIERWIIGEHKNSCPTCCKQVFSPPPVPKP